jgi:hypothetical protein
MSVFILESIDRLEGHKPTNNRSSIIFLTANNKRVAVNWAISMYQ